jgi:D-glycero-D-manno-heptose 1,7-bisphosphate phosphatase
MTLRPAAFIDRDGVLNEDRGYVHRIEDFVWLPGAIEALARLQQAGYALVIVTNQSGIARGLYTMADLDALNAHIEGELRRHGVALTGIYACPHHPQAVQAAYRLDCACRKPKPGLILQAAREHSLALEALCLFGDRPRDIDAGRAAGVARCWLIGDAVGAAAASLADAVTMACAARA